MDWKNCKTSPDLSKIAEKLEVKMKGKQQEIKINILPLIKKRHAEKARVLYAMLAKYCMVQYDESGSIGKRYRREDAISIPYAITVDDTTLEKETVTVRDRDTMEQCVILVSELITFLAEKSLI